MNRVSGGELCTRSVRKIVRRSLSLRPVNSRTSRAPQLGVPGIVRLSGSDLCPRWRGRVHLVALVAAVPAAVALMVRRPTPEVTVYAVSLVGLFGASSVYHLVPLPARGRRTMRLVDHVMIYVFLAACYTPFCWLAVPRSIGAPVLVVAWLGAAVGIGMKVSGFDRSHRRGAVLYGAIGWLVVVTAPYALHSLDPAELALLLATGTCYSAGAVALFSRRPDPVPDRFGYHEVWHTAVVAGAGCYFALIWLLAR
jgi:hemolysin III